jgi:hypothetical protein
VPQPNRRSRGGFSAGGGPHPADAPPRSRSVTVTWTWWGDAEDPCFYVCFYVMSPSLTTDEKIQGTA